MSLGPVSGNTPSRSTDLSTSQRVDARPAVAATTQTAPSDAAQDDMAAERVQASPEAQDAARSRALGVEDSIRNQLNNRLQNGWDEAGRTMSCGGSKRGMGGRCRADLGDQAPVPGVPDGRIMTA
jgi:hypothetical protein